MVYFFTIGEELCLHRRIFQSLVNAFFHSAPFMALKFILYPKIVINEKRLSMLHEKAHPRPLRSRDGERGERIFLTLWRSILHILDVMTCSILHIFYVMTCIFNVTRYMRLLLQTWVRTTAATMSCRPSSPTRAGLAPADTTSHGSAPRNLVRHPFLLGQLFGFLPLR